MAYGSPGGFRGDGSESGPGTGHGAGSVPSSVNTASVLLFVSGGLTLLGGLLLLTVSSLGALYTLLALVYLGLGAFEISLGLQLRQLRPGARSAAIVLGAASVGVSLLLLSRGGASTLIGMILPLVVIVLLYRPDAVAAFPRSNRPLGI
jgi:hypothetical protein